MTDPQHPATPSRPFLPRALWLIALVAIVDLWANHHYGLGLQHPGAIAGLLGAVSLAAGIVGRLVSKAEHEAVEGWLVSSLRSLVVGPALPVVTAVVACALAMASSVTLVGPVERATGIRVVSLDSPSRTAAATLQGGVALARVPVWTTPFGRPYRVEADGYVGGVFTVFPLTGLRLRLGEELRLLPSILLRPSIAVMTTLRDGSLRVIRVSAAGDSLVETLPGVGSSYLLGQRVPIPPLLIADWERDLRIDGATPVEAETIVRRWRSPQVIAMPAGLTVGSTVAFEAVSRAGKVVARVEVRLTSDPLIDVSVR